MRARPCSPVGPTPSPPALRAPSLTHLAAAGSLVLDSGVPQPVSSECPRSRSWPGPHSAPAPGLPVCAARQRIGVSGSTLAPQHGLVPSESSFAQAEFTIQCPNQAKLEQGAEGHRGQLRRAPRDDGQKTAGIAGCRYILRGPQVTGRVNSYLGSPRPPLAPPKLLLGPRVGVQPQILGF